MANFMPFEVVFVLWLHKRQEGGGNNYILRWREKKKSLPFDRNWKAVSC